MVKYIRMGIVGILLFFGVQILGFAHEVDYQGIHYDHVRYSDNVDFYGVEGLNLQYSANLSYVGDSYELYFDVVNDSEVDVIFRNISYREDDSYIDYELTYENGDTIHEGDLLLKGESKTIHYKVIYHNPIQENSYQPDSSFSIQFEQKI